MLTKVIQELPGAYSGMPYAVGDHLLRAAYVVGSECHCTARSTLLGQYTMLPVTAMLCLHHVTFGRSSSTQAFNKRQPDSTFYNNK